MMLAIAFLSIVIRMIALVIVGNEAARTRDWRLVLAGVAVAGMVFEEALGLVGPRFEATAEMHLEGPVELLVSLFVLVGVLLLRGIIREREAARDDARRHETLLKAVLETAPVGINAKDRELRYLFMNRYLADLYGVAPAAVIGRTPEEVLGAEIGGSTRAIDESVLSGEARPPFELTATMPTGRTVTMLATKTPIRDDQGRITGIVTAALDVSFLREVDQRRRQAQKLEAIGQLAGGIAHDFNNLLTVILGNIELLTDRLGDDARANKYVQAALRAADRGAALTGRLLSFARDQSLASDPIDVNKVIVETTDLLGRTLGENVRIEVSLAPDLGLAAVDPHELENALINLAVNARDAMPMGGTLAIETVNADFDRAYAEANPGTRPGPHVVMAVSDTGTGMPAHVVEHAFEPFFTTKEKGRGTGLGLAAVYGFAKQSGGHAKIYSEIGHGTTVRLYLPRADAAEGEAAPADEPGPAARSGETVLVLDDDADVRRAVEEALRKRGYRVLGSADAEAARALLAGPERIDLVLADVVLADGTAGRDVALEARRMRPGIKVIFASGYAPGALAHNRNLDPGTAWVVKPYEFEGLARRIRAALDETAAPAGAAESG